MKKTKFIALYALFFLTAAALVTSCKKDDRPELPPGETARLDGIWQSEGHGYVLEIKAGIATAYDITSDYGIKKSFFFDASDADTRTWNVLIGPGDKSFIYRSKNLVTEFRFRRLNKLPKPLQDGGLKPSNDPLLNFDVLWQTFKEHYLFFRQRNVDWDALRAQYRPQVAKSGLETVVKAMLTHLNEDHVTLTTTTDDFLARFDAGINRTLRHLAADLPPGYTQEELKLYTLQEYQKLVGNIAANYVQDVQVALNDQLLWGGLDSETGYLLVSQMAGYELSDLKVVLNDVIRDLKKYKRLVIDLRGNLGGFDRVSLELAGRFVKDVQTGWLFSARDGAKLTPPQRILLYPTGPEQFVKPIRILTSIATASAAEVFTLMLKQQPYLKTIGESTNGIFSTILTKELPNGWRFSLSNEVLTDAYGRSFEVTGIAPDLSITALPSAADRNNGVDPLLAQYKTWF